jgi:hypothetical protein
MKFLIFSFFLISCSSGPEQLTEKGKNVEIYAQKPSDCRVTGRIVGVDKKGSKELALNQALNEAAKLGSTGIFVNQEIPNGSVMSVHATAYNCN